MSTTKIHMNLRDFLSSDTFQITTERRLNYNIKTDINFPQRKVISLIHSVFDPIGITVPLLVKHKLFLRNLFVNNL
uniref:Uncharacterized protein n=1 Tax=Heterorhabditis bacteriophora TaxID=37862 RepID=A0A1I7XWE3_HETBA